MTRSLLLLSTLLLSLISPLAAADYGDWPKSGSLFINTTPEGANLPETATEVDFPLLVRLHKDFFDFNSAKEHGEDVRFTLDGQALAYQIEEWDAQRGTASIWVRIPKIQGNKKQELKIHWGKADAVSESNGNAVFNNSNQYLSVLHMDDSLEDVAGSVVTKNVETTSIAGRVGQARHLAGRQGVFCGEQITNFPVGANPHTTEAWIRAEQSNGRALAWGNEHGQGKVVMHFMSPPHVKMECYFSGADVSSDGTLPMKEWIHIMHTYEKGDSRIYVNGRLSNVSKTPNAPLAIKSPARFYIGGWYNNYDFVGDVDEVRISSVVRSPDWVHLQYENQKEMNTLVGPLVQNGSSFEVNPSSATIAEGGAATFHATLGGVQKIFWILKKDGMEKVVAVDRSSYTLEAGRITGDTSITLQCRALTSDRVKSQDIPISIQERIPEPVFTLSAPKDWDGRRSIEVVPQVSNLAAMLSSGAGELTYEWSAGPIAVIKETSSNKLKLKRSQNSGKLIVTATLSNGGAPVSQSVEIQVTEPSHDPWVARTPAKDEKPQEGQFYARDDKNQGVLHYNGVLSDAAEQVFLKLYAGETLVQTATAKPDATNAYALSVILKPGLIKYRVEFGTGKDNVLERVGNLVCGDAYIIDGQSNALATDTGEKSPAETNEWIRSYASPSPNPKDNEGNLWVLPVWKAQNGERAELGWWGMELAKRLVESQQIPIFMINAAVGGTRIDMHQRNPSNPTDRASIYGRMLWRVEQAKLTHGIRGILWHQGENDQGADGPTGGYGWETYHRFFIEMAAGWKQDFPNVKNYYVFQIWPNSCSMGGRFGSGDMLREKQRSLNELFSNMRMVSTLGVRPPGGCHFPLEGWGEFARMVQPLLEADHYGRVMAEPLTAPNLRSAHFNSERDSVVLDFDQPIVWDDKLVGHFYLDGEKGKVLSGSVDGSRLTLQLRERTASTKITYLKEIEWNQELLLLGKNGIAALTFCNVRVSE